MCRSFVTVTVQVALTPLPSCAAQVIVAVPFFSAVTTPSGVTAAIVSSLLDQAISLLAALLGFTVALSVKVWPPSSVRLVLFRLMPVTG